MVRIHEKDEDLVEPFWFEKLKKKIRELEEEESEEDQGDNSDD